MSKWTKEKYLEITKARIEELESGEFVVIWLDLCDREHRRVCKTKEEAEEKINNMCEGY